MNTLVRAKEKILEKCPPDLRPLMEMYMDYFEEAVTEEMVESILKDGDKLLQKRFNKIYVNDLKTWALTQRSKVMA